MVDVRTTEEATVQRLRLGEGKIIDEEIQKKLRCFSTGNWRVQVSRIDVKRILYILSILSDLQFLQLIHQYSSIQK